MKQRAGGERTCQRNSQLFTAGQPHVDDLHGELFRHRNGAWRDVDQFIGLGDWSAPPTSCGAWISAAETQLTLDRLRRGTVD